MAIFKLLVLFSREVLLQPGNDVANLLNLTEVNYEVTFVNLKGMAINKVFAYLAPE